MSSKKEQRDAANDFARRKLGPEVDAAAGSTSGFRVKDGGDGDEREDGKAWVELPGDGRQVSEFAKEVGAILADHHVYLREGYPVTIDERKGRLEVLEAEDFRSFVESYMVPFKWKAVKGGVDREWKTMTADCARATIKSRMFRGELREIERVNQVRMPVFRAGGQLELLPEGYDEESKTYTLHSAIPINEELTAAEGQTMLRDYLKEFAFVDPRSLGVTILAMVGLYAVGLQEPTAARLSFVFRSNVEGAGKSLLAQFAITPAFGLAKGSPMSGTDELRKLLDATAMQGSPYLFLDNLTGNVKSDLLDAYLTTPIWTGRLLGTSKIFEAPANAMLLITGNNITLSPDISRRSLLCNLHIEEADPQERKIARVITPQYLARPAVRGDLLSALWAMIRGWDQAGPKARPPASRRIAGFAEWCDIVGGIVEHNGFVGALEKPKDEESANPKEVEKRLLVRELGNLVPADMKMAEFTFQQLVDVCYKNECFLWMMEGKMFKGDPDQGEVDGFECNAKSAASLGRLFGTEMAGQIYKLPAPDGRRVRFGKRGNNRHRKYQLEFVA